MSIHLLLTICLAACVWTADVGAGQVSAVCVQGRTYLTFRKLGAAADYAVYRF